MHISKIKVKNFRLLQQLDIDLERELSLVVGKNNSGKTSLLKVLNKFLNYNEAKFTFEDFTLSYHPTLENLFGEINIAEDDYQEPGIVMQIFIHYDMDDDLEYISPLVNLDPKNNYVGIELRYSLTYTLYQSMRKAYGEYISKENEKKKKNTKYKEKGWQDFLAKNLQTYFKIYRYSIPVDVNGDEVEGNVIDLNSMRDVFKLEDVISLKYIDARRKVENKDANSSLSEQSSRLFQQMDNSEEGTDAIDALRDQLRDMDEELTNSYASVFNEVIEDVKLFGGISPNETLIKIVSSLHQDVLLKDHTTVVYDDDGKQLPESHNGLGYMNLISMIFEIEYLRKAFARTKERKPADINLLFIEEPEAHTHPQMQYIFIKNIHSLLKKKIKGKKGEIRQIQAIMTTHSSHIVSECKFEEVKYLKKDGENGVVAKNLSSLEYDYKGHDDWYKFLKQYLTLDRSELFFADKAIFVEGDTERILMPTMMKIVDENHTPGKDEIALTSQNISIISVGNYTHIFTNFFNFIGFKKICIITDIDICQKEEKEDKNGNKRNVYIACEWDKTKTLYTSNSSLNKYLGEGCTIADLRTKDTSDKVLAWDVEEKKWKADKNGQLMVCYQEPCGEIQPRSFEDSFFVENADYMCSEDKVFSGLREAKLKEFRGAVEKDSFKLAKEGITSKATFAIDLLIDRVRKKEKKVEGCVEWKVPTYIEEGLLWLRKD